MVESGRPESFDADEVSSVTGICFDHLQALARNKHLGTLVHAAEAAGTRPKSGYFRSPT